MVNQQLLDYIKQQLQQGTSKEAISSNLLTQGWQVSDIEQAFNLTTLPNQSNPIGSTTSQPFSTFSQQQPRGSNKTLLVVFSAIGVLMIGGVAFGYFYYLQSPEQIIQKMIIKLSETKSLEYSGEMKAEVDTGNLPGVGNPLQPTQATQNKQASNFSINFNGVSDIKDLKNPLSSFSFKINTDAVPQGQFAFGMEIRSVAKIVYIKLSHVPNLGFLDLSTVKDQWIKIDTEALKKQFMLEKLEKQPKEVQKKQKLSPEQVEKLKTAFQQAKILKITEKLASEKIEGVNTHHFKFTIDKEEIIKLFAAMSQILQEKTLTEKELADFDKNFEAIELSEGEIWIGKNDLLPYKISLSSTIKETDKSKTSGKASFTLLLKNFNKPVQIEIPTQVKTIEEIMSGLFGGLQGRSSKNTLPPVPLNLPR